MTLGSEGPPRPHDDGHDNGDHGDQGDRGDGGDGARAPGPRVPKTDMRLMAVAGVLLAIPVVALMWVPSYAKESPALWGFPFFFWYQFLWVFLCSAATWSAYKLTLAARRTPGGKK